MQLEGLSRTAVSVPESASGGSSSSEASGFQQVLGDSHSSLPVWSQSYACSSPLPSVLGQVKLESFAMNGEIVHGEGQLLGKRSHSQEKLLVRENISTTEHDEHQGTLLTSCVGAQTGQTLLIRTAGAQSQQQVRLSFMYCNAMEKSQMRTILFKLYFPNKYNPFVWERVLQQNLRCQSIQSSEGNSLQQYWTHSAVSQVQLGAGGGNAVSG
ncbi:hypothetical protein KI387_012308, partial [Taxus chinensis]